MSNLLGTLLYVNGQFQAAKNPAGSGGGTVWWGEATGEPARGDTRPTSICKLYHYPGSRFSLPLEAGDERPVHRRSRPARIIFAWLSGFAAAAVAGLLVFFVLGLQQVNHTRERIRWSRQLQVREQEVNRLAREHQTLRGLLAVKAMELAKPDVLRAAYAGAPLKPPIKKQTL